MQQDVSTLMLWFRPDRLVLGQDQHLLGHPFERGPRIFLVQPPTGDRLSFSDFSVFVTNGNAVSCVPSNRTHFGERKREHPTELGDGEWCADCRS